MNKPIGNNLLKHTENLNLFQEMGFLGILRVVLRFIPLFITIYGGLLVFVLVRGLEYPFGRKITPYITQIICHLSIFITGLKTQTSGTPMQGPGAVVANHPSMMDIFVLNARHRIFFVAKKEIRSWFGVGILGIVTGTVFIERIRGQSLIQKGVFFQRLTKGDTLLFFPEGTTTNGLEIVPFKSSLFEAFFEENLRSNLSIQPVSVFYKAPPEKVATFYAWWEDDVPFAKHFTKILSAPKGGIVKTVYCEPIKISNFSCRKELAKACQNAIEIEFGKSMKTLQ